MKSHSDRHESDEDPSAPTMVKERIPEPPGDDSDETEKLPKIMRGGREVGDYRIEVSKESAEESIRESFSNFEIDSIEPFAEGLGNVVFLVNGDYIFRFPRHARADASLQTELKMVPKLGSHLSVAIPNFEYVGRQAGKSLSFVGYRKIPGVHLSKEFLEDEPGKPNPHLTEQIATFFREIHSFDVREALSSGVKETNPKKLFGDELHDAREHVYPMLRERSAENADEMIQRIEQAFDEYLSDEKNFEYEPKLLHGDLESIHILVDPKKRALTGIIDFGGLQIGDTDYDLWRPYFHYGREFIEELLRHYPHPDPQRLFRKMDFFWTAQMVRRVLRRIVLQDEKTLPRALAALETRILGK